MSEGNYKAVKLGPKEVEIPEEWGVISLSAVTKNRGQYGANESAKDYDESEYRYIRITDITEDGKLESSGKKSITQEENRQYELKNNDLLFARTGSAGLAYLHKINFSEVPCAFAGYLIRFKLDFEKIFPDYIYYYTHSYYFKSWINSIGRSTTLSNINAKEYRGSPIIYPPLPEQEQIASILSTVDKVIQQTDEVIEKSKELKKGLMQDLLTKGIGHDKFKTVKLGPKEVEIPEEWSLVNLGVQCKIYQPKTITKKDILEEGPYKVFGANGVIGYFTEYNHDKSQVLVTCRGATCGTVNFSDPKSWITGNAMVIKPKNRKNLSKFFLKYLLKTSNLEGTITGTAQPQITKSNLETYEIILPPLPEQEQIASILSTVDEKIQKEKNYKEKLQELKKGLMQDLLTGKVRVTGLIRS